MIGTEYGTTLLGGAGSFAAPVSMLASSAPVATTGYASAMPSMLVSGSGTMAAPQTMIASSAPVATTSLVAPATTIMGAPATTSLSMSPPAVVGSVSPATTVIAPVSTVTQQMPMASTYAASLPTTNVTLASGVVQPPTGTTYATVPAAAGVAVAAPTVTTTASFPAPRSYAATGASGIGVQSYAGKVGTSVPAAGLSLGLGYGMGARGVGGASPKDLLMGGSVVSERPISREELVSSGSLSEDLSGGRRGGVGA